MATTSAGIAGSIRKLLSLIQDEIDENGWMHRTEPSYDGIHPYLKPDQIGRYPRTLPAFSPPQSTYPYRRPAHPWYITKEWIRQPLETLKEILGERLFVASKFFSDEEEERLEPPFVWTP